MINDHELGLRNHILFDSERKVEIPSTTREVNLIEAVTANEEFSRYGFTLDVKGIMDLAHNTPDDIAKIKDVICNTINDVVGLSDFSKSQPFYPNFPEEVMEKSDFELAINAMLYYAFSQTDDPEMTKIANEIRSLVTSDPEDRIERAPLSIDKGDLKIAVSAGPREVESLLYDRTQAMSISRGHLEDIKAYAKEYPETWTDRIFGEGELKDLSMPSHETRANLAVVAYRGGDVESARGMLPHAEDVLRFASVLSADRSDKAKQVGMDANLSFEARHAAFSFSRPDKAVIKDFLDKSPDLFTSMWHRPDMWEKVMNRLDTRDDRFPRMERAFDNLRHDMRVDERGIEVKLTPGQDLERLIGYIRMAPADSRAEIGAFAEKQPKLFSRNIERIARDIVPGSDSVRGLCEAIEKHSSSVPAGQLMKLEHHIERADGWDYRVFANQKGGIHIEENDTRRIDIGVKADIIRSLDKAIEQNLRSDPVGKVYIAPELSGVTIPLRNQREASDGATLTKYSTIEGKAENNIAAFGIFWSNDGAERADIDLSVVGFKEGYKDPETIYYGRIKTEWGVHSGDYTSGVIAPEINGAVEYVFVDKTKCEELGIRYIVPEVHGFNIPFSKAETIRFCFMEKQGNLSDVTPGRTGGWMGEAHAPMFKGELINPKEIVTSYRLTQDTRSTVPLLYDLKDDKYIWVDKDIAVGRISNAVDKVSVDKTSIVLYEARHNDYPSIGELAERYAKANGGEIVKDIKEADLVFSFGNIDVEGSGLKEGVEIISSFELDKISAELCNAIDDNEDRVEQEEDKPDTVETIQYESYEIPDDDSADNDQDDISDASDSENDDYDDSYDEYDDYYDD